MNDHHSVFVNYNSCIIRIIKFVGGDFKENWVVRN